MILGITNHFYDTYTNLLYVRAHTHQWVSGCNICGIGLGLYVYIVTFCLVHHLTSRYFDQLQFISSTHIVWGGIMDWYFFSGTWLQYFDLINSICYALFTIFGVPLSHIKFESYF